MAVFWSPAGELLAGDRSLHTSLPDVCPGDPSPPTRHRRDSSHRNGPEGGTVDTSKTLASTVHSVKAIMDMGEWEKQS